jgi:hypothetical protein
MHEDVEPATRVPREVVLWQLNCHNISMLDFQSVRAPLAVVLGGVLGACAGLPTAREANVSFSTVESQWPASTVCLNSATPTGIAKEVLIGSTRTVVIAGGPSPISDEAWASFSPGLGNQKNSDRHLLFARSCYARSPSRSASCVGDDCREIVTLGGYSWVALSKIDAADCLPSSSACSGTTPRPGGLLVVVTQKCHELIFEGTAFMLRGPNGERAVMHATPDGRPTTDVTLPAGWTLTMETLASPLVVRPFGGGDRCFYNIIRDHRQQSYHQLSFAGATYP